MFLKRIQYSISGVFIIGLIIFSVSFEFVAGETVNTPGNLNRFYGNRSLNPLVDGGTIIVSLPGQTEVEIKTDNTTYVVTDHLESARVVLDTGAHPLIYYEYTPFGETKTDGALDTRSHHGYTGHSYNDKLAIYETPHRVYDPSIGRWLSVDPEHVNPSPYVYAGNNPVVYLDPTGLIQVPFFVKSIDSYHATQDNMFSNLAKQFLKARDQFVYDADNLFGPNHTTAKYNLSLTKVRSIIEQEADYTYSFNDQLYWFIGDKETVTAPPELVNGLESLRGLKSYFADRVVLLDFTENYSGHQAIADTIFSTTDKWPMIFGVKTISEFGKETSFLLQDEWFSDMKSFANEVHKRTFFTPLPAAIVESPTPQPRVIYDFRATNPTSLQTDDFQLVSPTTQSQNTSPLLTALLTSPVSEWDTLLPTRNTSQLPNLSVRDVERLLPTVSVQQPRSRSRSPLGRTPASYYGSERMWYHYPD